MKTETSQQLLRNPDILPSADVLAEALKTIFLTYSNFTDMLSAFNIELQWRYYNDGKAWLCKGLYTWKTPRGTEKEKTVFWLSVWEGFFKVTFFIKESSRADLQNISLSENTKNMIANATTVGKLKFFPLIFNVNSNDVFGDLSALIGFQKSVI